MRNLVICFITCLMVYTLKAQSWSIQATGTTETLLSVFAPTRDICYTVGTEGTILKTDNGGVTWVAQSSGTTMDLHAVFFTDISIGYAAGESGTIIKTINGGTTWVPEPGGIPGRWLESIYFIDANTGFVAGRDNWSEEGYILKTIDAGINWTTIYNTSGFGLLSIYFPVSDTGYATGTDGAVIKSVDGGLTWNEFSSGLGWQDLRSAFFSDGNTGYMVGDAGTVLKTINGGNSFQSLAGGTTNHLFNVYFTGSDSGYIVGQDGIILKTINGGTSWNEIPSVTQNHLYSVYFADDSTGYAVGAQGTILKTAYGGTVFIDELKDQSLSATIYPNPATTAITISTGYSIKGETSVSIFNMRDQQLILHKYYNRHAFEFDISTLSTGIYLVKIQTKNGIENKKLVIR